MNINNWKFFEVFRSLLMGILIASLLLLLPIIIPTIFDFVEGKDVLIEAMTNAKANNSNPDEIALSIMKWEQKYFYNPYSLHDRNSSLQKFGIYKINGDFKLFLRVAPVSWIIFSRLANCGEYANVFAVLMNEAGIKTNIIHAPGEDHVWAEYMYEDYKIAVDPSQNSVIGGQKKDFEKNMNVKFSYIEAIDLEGNKMDVSDEYIERGNLTIFVSDNKKPVSDAQVTILNPSFMINRSDRFDKPLPVLSKPTGNEGKASFKLGYQKYNVRVRINQIYLLDSVYEKNITVDLGNENVIRFSLENDEKTNELFITRYR